MCGIASVLSQREPIDAALLERAIDAMRHRGPDGRGVFVSDDGGVGLGHARLSLVDLEGGAQPIANEDETVWAVVNGEIYDDEAWRRELEARGHRFGTRSDSEILVHLYEERGPGCVEALRGELAFVLYDARDRLLLAGRDRFGIKPLVYAEHRGRLLIASEAKALFAMGAPRAWDEASFFEAASLQYVAPSRTLFSGIRQLPPGHVLIARDGAVTTRRYWDLDLPREGDARASGADAAREIRDLLEDAVRVRLRGDVPVVCQLSGGLDSSAVAGLAARHRPIECFTVAFEAAAPGETSYDERAIALETAQHLGVPLHVVEVPRRAMAEHLSEAVFFSEGLAINGHLPAKHLLARAIRDAGFKAVLTGEGSDEVFLGYPHLRAELVDDASRLAAIASDNPASLGLMLPEGDALPTDAIEAALGFVPVFLRAKATLGRRVRSLLRPELVLRHAARDPFRVALAETDVSGQLSGRHRADVSRYLWTKRALAQYILRTLGDGTEMSSSVEGRVPFLDHRLFEHARTVAVERMAGGPLDKALLREAVGDVLTPRVRARPKHPFLAPPTLDCEAFRELAQDILRSQSFREGPLFSPEAVTSLLDRRPSMSARERAAWDPAWMTMLTSQLLDERLGLNGAMA
jgi:asparagine synthase (glutamine-hydrolysing)